MTLFAHLRRIAAVGGVETFGVVMGGVAGLLIVNVLPKDQYAQYTFLIACMTLILGVTDLGLAHCCLPVVGQRASEKPWVVGACHQVFHWRWLLLAAGLLIVVPYWWYTTREHGWWSPGYLLASLLVVSVVLFSLREHFANTVLLILGHIAALYRIGMVSTMVRMGTVGVVLLLPTTPYSVAGIVAATAAAGFISVQLYRKAFKSLDIAETRLDAEQARRVDAETLRIARPLVLPAVFYQVQGVITVFLVSLFGTATMLAEVGAFGRLAMILMVADRVTNVLLFPVIARAPSGPKLVKTVVLVHSLYLAAMAVMLLTALVVPQYWILLLGKQYASLTPMVWMMFLSSMLANAAGLAFRTLTVRGVTAKQSYSIPATLITQVLYLWIFGVSDLRSVLGFNIATAAAGFGYQYLLLLVRLPGWRKEAAPKEPAPT